MKLAQYKSEINGRYSIICPLFLGNHRDRAVKEGCSGSQEDFGDERYSCEVRLACEMVENAGKDVEREVAQIGHDGLA
jgi:hypothetical protein